MSFDLLDAEDEMKAHTEHFILWPRMWQEFTTLQSYQWSICKLDHTERNSVPAQPGIYTLIIQPGIANHPAGAYIAYVGKATDLRERFGNYYGRERRNVIRPHIHRLLNKYSDHLFFCFTPLALAEPVEVALKEVEDSLIEAFLPPYNRELPATVSSIRRAIFS